jgi:selenocysteine lyase/cysteine desulfurase
MNNCGPIAPHPQNTSHGLNIAAQSLREEYIRVSPHGYNTEAEIAQVGEVLGDA